MSDETRCAADENFKRTFGRYPIPADLPEPSGDPADAAFADRFLRRGRPLDGRDLRVMTNISEASGQPDNRGNIGAPPDA